MSRVLIRLTLTLILGAYLFTASAFVYAYTIEKDELFFQTDVIERLARIETTLDSLVPWGEAR